MDERKEEGVTRKSFKELMCAIRCNPQTGLHEFYNAYAQTIQSAALSICHSMDKANEIINDVLMKMLKYARTAGKVDNPGGFVYTITINTAKDAVRELYMLPLDENFVAGEDGLRDFIAEDAFYSMIKHLSETERAIMIQRFVAQNTFQEIADNLGMLLPTVSSTYYRALDKIRKQLEKNKQI